MAANGPQIIGTHSEVSFTVIHALMVIKLIRFLINRELEVMQKNIQELKHPKIIGLFLVEEGRLCSNC